jgi:hypothetical protein
VEACDEPLYWIVRVKFVELVMETLTVSVPVRVSV